MAKTTHLVARLLRLILILGVLVTCFGILLFTPFYSKGVLFVLNHIVPIEVNKVAAKSQQMAALSEHDELEPGSNLWIARQAYLKVLQDAAQREDAASLNVIQTRYKLLEAEIERTTPPSFVEDDDEPKIGLEHPRESKINQQLEHLKTVDAKRLMDKYTQFLLHSPVRKVASEPMSAAVSQDLAQVNATPTDKLNEPSAIVVLGGGLTKSSKDIVVNNYTRLRLEKTLEIEKENTLPIVLSGVEAPYMQTWLKQYGVDAKLLENRSMNTCENSRFSSLLLQKKGGAPKVILITDEYHMPRTRRLFAMNGIETIPVDAPIPTPLTAWKPARQNYDHSRRANYELLASIRDIVFGTSDCREVP